MMQRSKVVSLGLCLVGAEAWAVAAYGPSSHPGTFVASLSSCRSVPSAGGSPGFCVDPNLARAACGACSATNVLTMLNGTYYYTLINGSCASDCDSTVTSCGGGAGNYYQVTGSNGYDFRQMHLNPSSAFSSKAASRGAALGLWGATGSVTSPQHRADNRQNGTRLSAWYTSYVTCGSPATSSNLVGDVRLQ